MHVQQPNWPIPPPAPPGWTGTSTRPVTTAGRRPGLYDRFELIGELGSGGEATVHRARERATGTEYAIRIFRDRPNYQVDWGSPEYAAHFPERTTVRIFERGVEYLAVSNSPAMIEQHYEIMEYCAYGALWHLVGGAYGRMTERRFRDIVEQLTDAVITMHPVVHGDIKPGNILIRSLEPLDLVLGDFGVARRVDHTHTRYRGGTPRYRPPESEGTSTATDWWGLGMTLLDLFVGRNVFDALGADDDEVRLALETRPVPLDCVHDLGSLSADRIRLLLSGLFVKGPGDGWKQRWTGVQVRRWLAGESPTVPEGVQIGVLFAGVLHHRLDQLGAALEQQWDTAERFLRGPGASEVAELADFYGRRKTFEQVMRIGSALSERAPMLVSVVAAWLNSEAPARYKQHALTPAGLAALATTARRTPGSAESADIERLFTSGLLSAVARVTDRSDLAAIDHNWHSLHEETRHLLHRKNLLHRVDPRALLCGSLIAALAPHPAAATTTLRDSLNPADLRLADRTSWFRRLRTDR